MDGTESLPFLYRFGFRGVVSREDFYKLARPSTPIGGVLFHGAQHVQHLDLRRQNRVGIRAANGNDDGSISRTQRRRE